MKKATEFFEEKKPWSRMKDAILGKYLVPYLMKVKNFKQPIIIVDGFAGCGTYADGSDGSPLIICKVIEKYGVTAFGVFIEKNPDCFAKLAKTVEDYEKANIAVPVLGDFEELTDKIASLRQNSPMFIYIDPFGLKGMRFSQLETILRRSALQSTEVLINFSYKTLLREASAMPQLVDDVMGGAEYRAILEDQGLDSKAKETAVLNIYKDKLRHYFKYVGSCPILYADDKSKYHLIFATNNFDGIEIMNNIMHKEVDLFYSEGKLFPVFPIDEQKNEKDFRNQIIGVIREHAIITRGKVKEILVPRLFRIYSSGDYSRAIEDLVNEGVIFSETGRGRMNDTVSLSLTVFEERDDAE